MKNLLATFEGWSKTSFILAAVLIAAFAIATAVYNITDNPVVQDAYVVAPATIVFAVMGALGLHSGLIEETPWLVRLTIILSLIGLIGGLITTLARLLEVAGVVAMTPTWVNGFSAVIPLGYLGLFLTGIAVLRSELYSHRIGLLLILIGILVILNFTGAGLLGNSNSAVGRWAPPMFDGMIALVFLAIGLSLPEKTPQIVAQQT